MLYRIEDNRLRTVSGCARHIIWPTICSEWDFNILQVRYAGESVRLKINAIH